MGTRGNIVIKKTIDGNENFHQMYSNSDSYPSYLGVGIQERLNKIMKREDKEKILSTPQSLAEELPYEDEEKFYLHGDIEYLYVIDIDKEMVSAYSVWLKGDVNDIDMVNGKSPSDVEKLIYEIPFDAMPSSKDFEEYDNIYC